MNPKLQFGETVMVPFVYHEAEYLIPKRMENEFKRNPDRALRDYFSIASAGDQPYMPPYAWLRSTCEEGANEWDDFAVWVRDTLVPKSEDLVVDRRRVTRLDRRARHVHIDLGHIHDACGIVMVHIDSEIEIGPRCVR